jgi:hypothetical protein
MNAVVDKTGDRVFSAIAAVSEVLGDWTPTETGQEDHECQRDQNAVHDNLPNCTIALFDLFNKSQLVQVLFVSALGLMTRMTCEE